MHKSRYLFPCCSVVFITIIFNSSRIFHQMFYSLFTSSLLENIWVVSSFFFFSSCHKEKQTKTKNPTTKTLPLPFLCNIAYFSFTSKLIQRISGSSMSPTFKPISTNQQLTHLVPAHRRDTGAPQFPAQTLPMTIPPSTLPIPPSVPCPLSPCPHFHE